MQFPNPPQGLSEEERNEWYDKMRCRCTHYGILLMIVGAILIGWAFYNVAQAGGDDLTIDEPHTVTIFRGDGHMEIDTDTGRETVFKEPTKKNVAKRAQTRRGARVLAGGDNTLWIMDNRGSLRACTTVGTGYTGGSQRVKCN